MSTGLRILVVAEDVPWPQTSGYRIRLANVIRALTDAGEVDCFFVRNDLGDEERAAIPEIPGVARWEVVRDAPPTSKLSRTLRWLTTGTPLWLLWRSWKRAPSRLRAFVRQPYDLVWFSHVDGYVALGSLLSGRRIVDLDTLEDRRLLQLLRASDDGRQRRSWARRVVDRIDVRRWQRLHGGVAKAVDAIVVCSEVDRVRLGVDNAHVIPNGYELEPGAEPRRSYRPGRIMTMVGVFSYEPNHDAASWFALEVLPLVRQVVPNAEFRIVGRVTSEIQPLAAVPGVVLRDFVPDLGEELQAADVEVVPIRSGGGTRLKVLEAFAHRVPVVSTTIGCDGLGVEDGQHLLIADTADQFARATVAVLSDPGMQERLATGAYGLFDAHYRWSDLRPLVAQLAQQVARNHEE